jgi:hypothetical protein
MMLGVAFILIVLFVTLPVLCGVYGLIAAVALSLVVYLRLPKR